MNILIKYNIGIEFNINFTFILIEVFKLFNV